MTSLPDRGRRAPDALTPAFTRAERRQRGATTVTRSGQPAGSGESARPTEARRSLHLLPAAVAEAQAAHRLLTAASTVLDEVGFLLRRLRTVAVTALSADCTGSDRTRLQDQVFTLVQEISTIGSQARCGDVRLFDGSLADQQVWVGSAGQPVHFDLRRLDGVALGIEHPWGHANRSSGLPARLAGSTGTLPSGIFRVDETCVYDESGVAVGTYQHPTVIFHDGVTATFDRCLYYRDSSSSRGTGTFTLNSVLSVRNPRAAEQSLGVIGDALAEVRRRRQQICESQEQLSDAIIALDIVAQNSA